jgi:lipopolysaccharide/colanic/teichoic acid biosynthesis glycosyltransferase
MEASQAVQSWRRAEITRFVRSRKTKSFNLSYMLRENIVSNIFLIAFYTALFLMPRGIPKTGWMGFIISKTREAVKLVMDKLFVIIGLILTAPLFLVIGILIKLTSPGTMIFKQERIGRNRRGSDDRRVMNIQVPFERRQGDRRKENKLGKPFNIYKFRTMVQDAEKVTGPVWAQKKDPRVTKTGRFLRFTRLDEIPQFINVLAGDMSLVGPRPERYILVTKVSDEVERYSERFTLNPGITGLAQVKSGYASTVETNKTKAEYDLAYIKSWSISKDILILLRSVFVVLTGKGAV